MTYSHVHDVLVVVALDSNGFEVSCSSFFACCILPLPLYSLYDCSKDQNICSCKVMYRIYLSDDLIEN